MQTSSRPADSLFTPYRLKSMSLPNRIVMAPMTRSFSPGQVPGPDVADYYARRAKGGVGLIITEGTAPAHPAALNDDKVPHFYGTEALAGWRRVVDAVKAEGGLIMPQLWHTGMKRKPGTGSHPHVAPVGPSGITGQGKQVADPMALDAIDAVIAGFAESAGYAKDLGFDGVEIHGAHGYLIDQFFWERTNQRGDRFGGGLLQRTQFATDLIRAVRAKVGPDFPILLRWSQWKGDDYEAKLARTPQELEIFLGSLANAGVDVFHCSQRRFWEPEFAGSDMNLAGWVKKLTGKPTITVGSIGLSEEFTATFRGASAGPAGIDHLLQMFERGDFDLVAVGRALIVNPDWANLVRHGRMDALKPYTPEALKSLV